MGESDGLRLISSTTCEIIQKVPDASLAIFSPGSAHPAAILYDALEHFDRKSPKADESIRSIRPELASAVDTCIEAAGREWDTYWQRRLLRVCHPSMYDAELSVRRHSLAGRSWTCTIRLTSSIWRRRSKSLTLSAFMKLASRSPMSSASHPLPRGL